MKEEELQQVLDMLQRQSSVEEYLYWLVFFMFGVLSSILAAYLKGYGSEKGKLKALNENIEQLQGQLSENTKITESLKSEIELASWRHKDRELIKREKLEQYLTLMISLPDMLHAEMNTKFFLCKESPYDASTWEKASMLQSLYLPELSKEHNEFRAAKINFSSFMQEGLRLKAENIRALNDVNAPVPNSHLEGYGDLLSAFNTPLVELNFKAKEIAKTINN